MLTTDAVRVHPGDPVRIKAWDGDRPLEGRVRRVEPGAFTKVSALGVDEQRTNVVDDISSPIAERGSLSDAYRVDVRIVTTVLDDAIVVPAGAPCSVIKMADQCVRRGGWTGPQAHRGRGGQEYNRGRRDTGAGSRRAGDPFSGVRQLLAACGSGPAEQLDMAEIDVGVLSQNCALFAAVHMIMPRPTVADFKGSHFEREIILWAYASM